MGVAVDTAIVAINRIVIIIGPTGEGMVVSRCRAIWADQGP